MATISMSESPGLLAGYKWPQYAVHRGRFHMLLYDKLVERAGRNTVRLGHRVTGYRKNADGSVTAQSKAQTARSPRRAAPC